MNAHSGIIHNASQRKQPERPSAGEWISKWRHIHTTNIAQQSKTLNSDTCCNMDGP